LHDTDAGGYYHPLFLQSRPDLVQILFRTHIKGSSKQQQQQQKSPPEPDLYAYPACNKSNTVLDETNAVDERPTTPVSTDDNMEPTLVSPVDDQDIVLQDPEDESSFCWDSVQAIPDFTGSNPDVVDIATLIRDDDDDDDDDDDSIQKIVNSDNNKLQEEEEQQGSFEGLHFHCLEDNVMHTMESLLLIGPQS